MQRDAHFQSKLSSLGLAWRANRPAYRAVLATVLQAGEAVHEALHQEELEAALERLRNSWLLLQALVQDE